MMRRNHIAGIAGGLLLLLIWGMGPVVSRAAETKAVPPAQPAAKPIPVSVPAAGPAAPRAADTKAVQPAQPAAKPAPEASPDYRYSPAGKPDPFKPFLEMDLALKKKMEEEAKKKAAAMGRPISPLQQADLGQFRLLGIAGDEKKRAAIVADGATKKFYPIFVGTYIGLNEGRVAAILPDRLVVEERIGTPDKKTKQVQVRQIPVLLHKEQ